MFLFQEITFRFFFPLPEIRNFNRIKYVQGEIANLSKNHVRNINVGVRSSPDSATEFIQSLNYYGFRDGRWKIAKTTGKRRIIFIGDSFVEGMMASDEQTIPKGFEQSALERNRVLDVMNFGISGGNWSSYLRLVTDALPIFKPDDVVLVIYGNDSLGALNFSPHEPEKPHYYNRYKPRLIELISLLLAREMLPFRWNLNKMYFTWNDDEMRKRLPPDTWLARLVKPDIVAAIKQGRFNPGLINWPLRAQKFLQNPYDFRSELEFLKNYTMKYNARLWVAYLPLRNQITQYYHQYEKDFCLACPANLNLTTENYQMQRRNLASNCYDLGIPFYDLSDPIREEEESGKHLYWNYDIHMRGEGYLKLGQYLFTWWQKLSDARAAENEWRFTKIEIGY